MSPISTQDIIDIAGIKDGVVILRNGGYRIVMSVSTVNFALKSEQEQNALIFQYQSFLNSLHFPIEIVMRSKRLDLTPYLQKISMLISKQENELLKIQTEDYVDFVSKLINLANIMKKSFYVAIPFQPITLQKTSFADKIFNRKKTIGILRISEDEFKKNSEELKQRAGIVASGLGAMGLHCIQLTTEEIIELFYQIYNPEIANKERVTDAEALTSPVVEHTSEKKDGEKDKEKGEEVRIDNSEAVQAAQKQQYLQKQQEILKEGERQIVTTGVKKASEEASKSTPEKEGPAPSAEKGQVPAKEEVGKPLSSAPANSQPASSAQTMETASLTSGLPANNPQTTASPQAQPLAGATKQVGNEIRAVGQNPPTSNN